MASVALKVLRVLITAFLIFIFFTASIVKLTDRFSPKTYQKMVGISVVIYIDRIFGMLQRPPATQLHNTLNDLNQLRESNLA